MSAPLMYVAICALLSLINVQQLRAVQLAKQAANVDVAVDGAALRNWLYHCRQAGACGPAAAGHACTFNGTVMELFALWGRYLYDARTGGGRAGPKADGCN